MKGSTFKYITFGLSAVGSVCVLASKLIDRANWDLTHALYKIGIALVFIALIPGIIWLFSEE